MNSERSQSICFVVLTFLWAWLAWSPLVLAGFGVHLLDEALLSRSIYFFMVVGAFGPAVGAVLTTLMSSGKSGLRQFAKPFLSLNFGWVAWLTIFSAPAAVYFIPWIAAEFAGYQRIESSLSSVPEALVILTFVTLLGGGQEEIGWRGYLMERLEKRHGLFLGNIILGTLWATWHIPLWLIPGTSQSFMPFAAFVLMCIGLSFLFSGIVESSRGRFTSAILAHGLFNFYGSVFPTLSRDHADFQLRFWIQAFLALAIGAAFLMTLKKRTAAGRASRAATSA